jgi:hypothetical protein
VITLQEIRYTYVVLIYADGKLSENAVIAKNADRAIELVRSYWEAHAQEVIFRGIRPIENDEIFLSKVL